MLNGDGGTALLDWLSEAGLAAHYDILVANQVDLDIVADLTEADLTELGLSLGDRKRFLRAVRALGAPDPQPGGPEPEGVQNAVRRQISVLFCDIVGSTEITYRLDPEDFQTLIHEYRKICTTVCERYSGHVAEFIGDGISVYFGYGEGQEGHAERSVQAALELIQTITTTEFPSLADLQQGLSVRIAIVTDEVIASEFQPGAERSRMESVFGIAPFLASRLQSLAKPNEVLIGDATRALVSKQFALEDFGTHVLKGFPKPEQVWRVTGARRLSGRFEPASADALSGFVGREDELGQLLARHGRVTAEGGGSCATILGDAGIGKSRLLHEFLSRIGSRRNIVLHLQCVDLFSGNELYAIRKLLSQSVARRFGPHRPAGDQIAKLVQRYCDPADAEEFDHFASVLVGLEDGPSVNATLPPAFYRRKFFEFIRNVLHGLAARRHCVVILEDIQWADETTLALVNELCEDIGAHAITLLQTSREPLQASTANQETLALRPLTPPQCTRLAESVAGGRKLPRAMIDEIYQRTGGLPLFVEEFTKTLIESGVLLQRADEYVYVGGNVPANVPDTVRDLLETRLDQLGRDKLVVQIASVIGARFTEEVLCSLLSVPVDTVSGSLQRLADAGYLTRQRVSGTLSYGFRHAPLQDAAYQGLLHSTRRELHETLASLYESELLGLEAEPEVLAFHMERAHRFGDALRYCYQAGLRAKMRASYVEAINYFERASRLYDQATVEEQDLELKLRIVINLGASRRILQGFTAQEVHDTFRSAVSMADETDSIGLRVQALRGLWVSCFTSGQLAEAGRLAAQVREIGQAEKLSSITTVGCWMQGVVYFWRGEFDAALTALELSLARVEVDETLKDYPGIQSRVMSLCYLSWTHAVTGDEARAVDTNRSAVEEARRSDDPFALVCALIFDACIFLPGRRPAFMGDCLTEALDLCAKYDFSHWRTICELLHGHERMEEAPDPEAYALIRAACEKLRLEKALINLPWALQIGARAALALGRAGEALAYLDEADAVVAHTGAEQWQAEILRTRANALIMSGEPRAAETTLRAALTLAQKQNCKGREARLQNALANLTADAADHDPAEARPGTARSFQT